MAERVANFMTDLRQCSGVGAQALKFLILTAARSGEVRGARWDEIDINAATWTIPGKRMKAGREHTVPLSDDTVALLREQPAMADNPLVFPSPRGKQLSDAALGAVVKRMNWDATVHGFRSTFSDWVSERTAYPSEVRERALAHAIADKTEKAYRRGDLLMKRRRMMADWAAFLRKTKSGDVRPIRQPKADIRGERTS